MMPPQESRSIIDYMSPLWGVLIIILLVFGLLYFLAKPLHKYLTDRKTEKIIRDQGLDNKNQEKETDKGEGEKVDKGLNKES